MKQKPAVHQPLQRPRPTALQRLVRAVVLGTVLLALAAMALFAVADRRFTAARVYQYEVPFPTILVSQGNAEHGGHLVRSLYQCTECHGDNLSGATVFEDALHGDLYAPNITPFTLGSWTDGEVARAIRHGLGSHGNALMLMPSQAYQNLSAEDLQDMVRYLRRLPLVSTPPREQWVAPWLKLSYLFGFAPTLLAAEGVDHARRLQAGPLKSSDADYGRYLVEAACTRCHGQSMAGGSIPLAPAAWPRASDLRPPALKDWSYADFVAAVRRGEAPNGRRLAPPMAGEWAAQIDDVELQAMWTYLKGRSPRADAGG